MICLIFSDMNVCSKVGRIWYVLGGGGVASAATLGSGSGQGRSTFSSCSCWSIFTIAFHAGWDWWQTVTILVQQIRNLFFGLFDGVIFKLFVVLDFVLIRLFGWARLINKLQRFDEYLVMSDFYLINRSTNTQKKVGQLIQNILVVLKNENWFALIHKFS